MRSRKKVGYADKKITDTSSLVQKQAFIIRLLMLEVKYLLSMVWLLLEVLMLFKIGYENFIV